VQTYRIQSTNVGENGGENIGNSKRKEFSGILIYFWWNIWKERKWRHFSGKSDDRKRLPISSERTLSSIV